MSRDEFESTKPRPAAVHTSQHHSRASNKSVRAGSSKPAGYDNPLYTNGDILIDRESDAGEVMPLVVGDHAVVTPRRPESPLVAKLKSQASDKSLKLRQDRILNSSVGVSPAFAGGNPAFPSSSFRSPRTSDTPLTKRNSHQRPPRTPQSPSNSLASPRALPGDDSDSVDSLVLDDGPNPVRVVTPGTNARARAFGDFDPTSTDDAAAPSDCLPDGADAGFEGAVDHARPSTGPSEANESEGAIAPQESMPAIAAGSVGTTRPEARPCTPQRDRDLLSLLSTSLKQFASTPGPILEPLKCYIVRVKAPRGLLSKAPHVYKLYLEDGDKFLLSARRREHTKCPSYVISLDESYQSRRANSYCGKTRSNFIGTEFQIFDAGERTLKRQSGSSILRQGSFFGGQRHSFNASPFQNSPTSAGLPAATGTDSSRPPGRSGTSNFPESKESESRRPSHEAPAVGGVPIEKSDSLDDWGGRAELGVVQYQMNVMGTKGPRRMVIGVPHVDVDTNVPARWQSQESMMPALKRGSDMDMIRLVNKVPKWNTSLGAYCLNFNGRVTLASVKNFQLVAENDEREREVLQFGRIGDHRFTMDYAWPLSAYQAFCICITSLDSKLACE